MEQQNFKGPADDLGAHLRELDRMLVTLDGIEARVSKVQITPGEVVYRDAHDAYHHITAGAVLSAYGISAHYARRLDGLLALDILKALSDDSLFGEWKDAFVKKKSVGEALLCFLDRAAGFLEAKGRHAEWRRRFDAYMRKTESFFAALDDEKRAAMLRKPATKKQASMVRYTCECLQLDFPALGNRWAAFEWLRDVGANPRYREVQP
jgi:hypothetical protein